MNKEAKIAQRVARRYQATTLPDFWMNRADVAELCPSCAQKMASLNISQVRASVFFGSDTMQFTATRLAKKWEGLPTGWTQESVKKFWDSLTGDVKHKVTKCIKEMDGKVDDPGAFCASARDRVEGTSWRKEAVSRPSAKGNPAYEALSDAWDLFAGKFLSDFSSIPDEIEMGAEEWQDTDPKLAALARKTSKAIDRLSGQSKSWAYAFNMLLEGRDNIDVSRMVGDIEKTLKAMEDLEKDVKKLEAFKTKLPDLWKSDLAPLWTRGMKAFEDTKKAFEKAVKLLKAGKTATSQKVAQRYLKEA